MNITNLLEHLSIKIVRSEGDNQWPCHCPWCDGDKMHVNKTSGLWHCKRGCGSGNTYQLVEKLTTLDSKGIKALLAKYIPGDADKPQKATKKAGKPRLKKDDVREMTPDELTAFCKVKGIDAEAFKKVMGTPYRHAAEPWALLPAYNPSEPDKQACGVLRAHMEGELIKTKHGEDKYPQVYGSTHGLFGVHWILKDNPGELIFAEGWRDCLAAVAQGFYATASSGGASCFKDEWLPIFRDRIVYIVMDRDNAGVTAAKRAAPKIHAVAKKVKIVDLPFELKKEHGKDYYDYVYEC